MHAFDNYGVLVFINSISVSILKGVLALSIIAICLLLGKIRLGIFAAYISCLHWAFVSQKVVLAQHFTDGERGILMFLFFGFSLAAWGISSVFQQDQNTVSPG